MLSEREQQALDVIEHRTAGMDPRFAASMRRARPTWVDRWAPHGYDATILSAAAAAVLCFALALVCAAFMAVAVVVAMCRLRPRHFRPRLTRIRAALRRIAR